MEFLRDPIWQFVGAVIGLIAIFVAVYIFSAQRSTKSLAYEVVTQTELLSIGKEIKGRVQILFEGKPVENVHLVTLRIANDGRQPIAAAHFERPLSFSFGKDTTILSADIAEVSPRSLKPSIIPEGNRITLNPTLLNSGDTIEIALLLAQYDDTIQDDARIEGVSAVKKGINSPLKPVVRAAIAFAVTAATFLTLVFILFEPARLLILGLAAAVVVGMLQGLSELISKRGRSISRRK